MKGISVLSFEECLQIGEKLKIKSDVIQAALLFFHHQISSFLHLRYVLPDLVFIKPKLPLDFISEVMQFNYKVTSGELKEVTQTLASSLRDGIITGEILIATSFSQNASYPKSMNYTMQLTC